MTAYLVAGLGFGDEGKGSIVDALVRRTGADLIIRYNGGSQCAHNVITPEGRHHTFAQFGSGTFVPGVKTYLSRFVLVDPSTMLVEAEELAKVGIFSALPRTYVDERAFVITRYHKALNRIQELARGSSRHGSTGMGIGITREMSLSWPDRVPVVGDIFNRQKMKEKLTFVKNRAYEKAKNLFPKEDVTPEVKKELAVFNDTSLMDWYLMRYAEWSMHVTVVRELPKVYTGIVFEGAQGMLLDERFGFQPHTTWTDITFSNAMTILREIGYSSPIHRIGVMRSYCTRHGDGPFPSQDDLLKLVTDEPHNRFQECTGDFRVGSFDIPLLIKSLRDIGGVDYLAINHLDTAEKMINVPVRLSKQVKISVPYHHFVKMIEEIVGIPVKITGHGPSYLDKSFKDDTCLSSL